MVKTADTITEDTQLYELGFLLSPLTNPDQVAGTLERLIKTPLQAGGGSVVHEQVPKNISLAYPIKSFNQAYFGLIYFRASAALAARLKAAWQAAPELVRCLLLKRRDAHLDWVSRPPAPDVKAQPEAGAKLSDEAIDREIEGLLVEAK